MSLVFFVIFPEERINFLIINVGLWLAGHSILGAIGLTFLLTSFEGLASISSHDSTDNLELYINIIGELKISANKQIGPEWFLLVDPADKIIVKQNHTMMEIIYNF